MTEVNKPLGDPGGGRVAAYTVQLPQTTYLAIKLHAAQEGVRLGRHVTINETIVGFIEAGLSGQGRGPE